MPIIEARLHNLPIFVPALDEIMSWAQELIIPYPIDASPNAIAHILEAELDTHRFRAKHTVRTRYSWDAIFEKYIGLAYRKRFYR